MNYLLGNFYCRQEYVPLERIIIIEDKIVFPITAPILVGYLPAPRVMCFLLSPTGGNP